MATFTVTLTENQMSVVSQACDLLSRVYAGQLDEIAHTMMGHIPIERLTELRSLMEAAGPLISGLPSHSHMGIHSVCERGRNAYDIHQVVRHALAWHRKPDGGVTVDFGKPLRYGSEPLATASACHEGV